MSLTDAPELRGFPADEPEPTCTYCELPLERADGWCDRCEEQGDVKPPAGSTWADVGRRIMGHG